MNLAPRPLPPPALTTFSPCSSPPMMLSPPKQSLLISTRSAPRRSGGGPFLPTCSESPAADANAIASSSSSNHEDERTPLSLPLPPRQEDVYGYSVFDSAEEALSLSDGGGRNCDSGGGGFLPIAPRLGPPSLEASSTPLSSSAGNNNNHGTADRTNDPMVERALAPRPFRETRGGKEPPVAGRKMDARLSLRLRHSAKSFAPRSTSEMRGNQVSSSDERGAPAVVPNTTAGDVPGASRVDRSNEREVAQLLLPPTPSDDAARTPAGGRSGIDDGPSPPRRPLPLFPDSGANARYYPPADHGRRRTAMERRVRPGVGLPLTLSPLLKGTLASMRREPTRVDESSPEHRSPRRCARVSTPDLFGLLPSSAAVASSSSIPSSSASSCGECAIAGPVRHIVPQLRIRPTLLRSSVITKAAEKFKEKELPSPLARRGAEERAYLQRQLRAETLARRSRQRVAAERAAEEAGANPRGRPRAFHVPRRSTLPGQAPPPSLVPPVLQPFAAAYSPPAILTAKKRGSIGDFLAQGYVDGTDNDDDDNFVLFFPDGVPIKDNCPTATCSLQSSIKSSDEDCRLRTELKVDAIPCRGSVAGECKLSPGSSDGGGSRTEDHASSSSVEDVSSCHIEDNATKKVLLRPKMSALPDARDGSVPRTVFPTPHSRVLCAAAPTLASARDGRGKYDDVEDASQASDGCWYARSFEPVLDATNASRATPADSFTHREDVENEKEGKPAGSAEATSRRSRCRNLPSMRVTNKNVTADAASTAANRTFCATLASFEHVPLKENHFDAEHSPSKFVAGRPPHLGLDLESPLHAQDGAECGAPKPPLIGFVSPEIVARPGPEQLRETIKAAAYFESGNGSILGNDHAAAQHLLKEPLSESNYHTPDHTNARAGHRKRFGLTFAGERGGSGGAAWKSSAPKLFLPILAGGPTPSPAICEDLACDVSFFGGKDQEGSAAHSSFFRYMATHGGIQSRIGGTVREEPSRLTERGGDAAPKDDDVDAFVLEAPSVTPTFHSPPPGWSVTTPC